MKHLLSIDVGSKFLKIVQGNGGKSVRTKKEVLAEMPENCVKNGFVTDFERTAATIRAALAKEKITDKKAVVTVSSPDIIVKELVIPQTNIKNTEQIVANELDEYLSGERYAIDYLTYSHTENTRVMALGIEKKVVDRYRAMLVDAGLTPVAFDIHANAVRKLVAVTDLIPHSTDMSIILDVGFDLLNFHFFVNGELTYTRCVCMDMDAYAKSNIGQMCGKTARELSDDVNFNTYVSFIGDEVMKMLQFKAIGEYKALGVKIYLSGGGARYDGICSMLAEYLNKEVEVLNTKILLNALGAQIRI